MIKNLLCTLLLMLALFTFLGSQNSVGLLSYVPAKSYDGYNLLYPHNQPNVYLLNNCGEIVHVWEDDPSFRPGNTAYLLEDGRLVKTKRPASVVNNPIWAGGGGAIVEIRDWDNNLEWSFELNNEFQRLHHDIEVLPNGNILMIVWELKTSEESIQAGRDTSLITDGELWPDYIIEVNPSTSEIVWEWHVWDHLIQDYDPTKDNYGVVFEHPELVDINWDTSDGDADWMHTNAIDYNAENDQIVISVPTFHEIWIIDHSTTTEQAASNIGGMGGRGGDLLYRWGNPAVYKSGTEADQKLFYQHDVHWVDDFLDFSHPHWMKLAVFNNRVGADYSTANVFNPGFDMYKWTYPLNGNTYGPSAFDLIIDHPEPTQLYSTGLSSVQFLPNGNVLITSGRFGYSFEITPDDEIVWEYKTPLIGGSPASQGDTLSVNNNLTFRVKRYPVDYEAFEDKELSAQGYIELNPDTNFCNDIVNSIEDIVMPDQLDIFPNPAYNHLTIEWEKMPKIQIEVFDLLGRRIAGFSAFGGRKYLDVSNWEKGVYFIQADRVVTRKIIINR